MTKSEVVRELDERIEELKPVIREVQTLHGAYDASAHFWSKYVEQKTNDHKLKEIADNDLVLSDHTSGVIEWMEYHLNCLERLKRELSKE